jgi:FKBP-type peptidyl-prolyl cis-trans isomerase
MVKQSPPANKRAAREAKRRSRQRRLLAVGTAAVVLVAAIAVIVYFAVRSDSPPEVSGLVTEDIVVGEGQGAQAGDLLSVYYTLYLEDGTMVQSNATGDPVKFTLGAGTVIKGWDQGLAGVKVGGTRQLIIPPDLAYGAAGNRSIPPNATLTFVVQLVAIG